jgi:prevent-host-death family protein
MKTATVRDLRNRYTTVLGWVNAGEDVLITQRGVVIARLTPETEQTTGKVDWSQCEAVKRDRSKSPMLSGEESLKLIHEASGKW